MSGYNPFDREIVLEAIAIWRSDERAGRLSIPDLYKLVLKKKPDWRPVDTNEKEGNEKKNEQNEANGDGSEETEFPPFTPARLQQCLEAVSLAPEQLETVTYADKIKSVFPVPGLVIPSSLVDICVVNADNITSNDDDGDKSEKNTNDKDVKNENTTKDTKDTKDDGAEKKKLGDGKGVFSKTSLPSAQTLWTEQPLFRVPAVSSIGKMRLGFACAYCGDSFHQPMGSVSCSLCSARFCTAKCRNAELGVHAATWHTSAKPSKTLLVKPKSWIEYEQFCFTGDKDGNKNKNASSAADSGFGGASQKNQSEAWMSGYAVGLVLIKIIAEYQKSKEKGLLLKKQFESMATISQQLRQAADSSRSLFASEQVELIWQNGYQLLKKAVSKAVSQIDPSPTSFFTYEWYLNAIGTWNLNNIRDCIFLVQSNFNHSCVPNIKIDFPAPPPPTKVKIPATGGSYLLNPISIVTIKSIAPNEQLTISYVDPAWSYQKRQEELKKNWGFACKCEKCVEDTKEWEVTVDDDGNIVSRS